MSLFQISITTSLLLTTLGISVWLSRHNFSNKMLSFARSNKWSVVLLTISLAWFIFRYVKNLSEADFGNHKIIIGAVAVFIYFGSFALVKDFLAVRSLCTLCLFYSREVLDAAWLQESTSRLFLVSIIYIVVTVSLYFGAWPYRFRDFFTWLGVQNKRTEILSLVIFSLGFTTLLLSFAL